MVAIAKSNIELRNELFGMITEVEDNQMLSLVWQMLSYSLHRNIPEFRDAVEQQDWADLLTEEQLASLDKARREVRLKENQIPHEEAMKRLKIGIYGTDLVSASH